MTTISFTGDIAFSKYFKNAWQDPSFIDDGIVKFLRDSDHVIANVECPLTAGDVSVDNSLTHATAPGSLACVRLLSTDTSPAVSGHSTLAIT